MKKTLAEKRWLPYEEAKICIHSLSLKSQSEWRKYLRDNTLPRIPRDPYSVYKSNWVSWQDWLGYEERKKRPNKTWRSFEDARMFVHNLNLFSIDEWFHYCSSAEKPNDIPNNPVSVYKYMGWLNWYDWLGKEKIGFLIFEEARHFTHNLNLKSKKEWAEYTKSRPGFLPASPSVMYKNKGWVNWQDWLGYENVIKKTSRFLPYKSAQEFAAQLNLQSKREWINYNNAGNKPANIPLKPNHIYYNKGWISWQNWLGYEKKVITPFESARMFSHTLKLSSLKEWNLKRDDLPYGIPPNPSVVYKKEWISWRDWLGYKRYSGNKNVNYYSFKKARQIVRKLKLSSGIDWSNYVSSNEFLYKIPVDPYTFYKNKGWISLQDWLGYEKIKRPQKNWASFHEARKYIHTLSFKSKMEFIKYYKNNDLPSEIPKTPDRAYRDKGWVNWQNWLGYEKRRGKNLDWRPYNEARKYLHRLDLKLQSSKFWKSYDKTQLPKDIPRRPDTVYMNKGWVSWQDWLGYEKFYTFTKARKIARNLSLVNEEEWFLFNKNEGEILGVPVNPQIVYEAKWKGWPDWLET